MIKSKNSTLFIIYLAGVVAFAPFSTDIYLASMPTIQRLFGTSAAEVQLTLSLFFVGFAIAQLLWGPLSDRIGRKPVLFIGISIYIVGSIMCGLSNTISLLIFSRIIQSIGACSGIVVGMAIVKDQFPDPIIMSKVLSRMMGVVIVAPVIAPIIGSYLLVRFNWQSNFYFLALYGVILFISTCFVNETYPKEIRKPLPLKKLSHAYTEQINCLPFLLVVLAVSTNFCVLFSFISSSSFIYLQIYHLPIHLYGYFFAFNATAIIVGSFSLPKLKDVFKDKHIVFSAILISLFGSLLMLFLIHIKQHSIWSVAIPSFIVSFGVGVLFPELTSYALKNVVSYTGIASSLLGSIRFVLAGGTGFLMGFVITNSAMPLAISMITLNILTLTAMIYYFKKSAVA